MKNQIRNVVIAAMLAACGGAQEFDDEIDTAEQPYSAKVSNNYQFGTSTATAHKQCNRTSTGQVCSVPLSKTISWCVGNDFSVDETGPIAAALAALDSASSFTFTQRACQTQPASGEVGLVISRQACSGTLSANIEGYSCLTFPSIINLTEGVADGDPVGSYQRHSSCSAKLDAADCKNLGTNATQDARCIRQAASHIGLTCMGLGSRDDSGANNAQSRRAVVIGSDLTTAMTPGEICRADSFNIMSNGDFSNQTPFTCGAD